jgi:hypothetical protein
MKQGFSEDHQGFQQAKILSKTFNPQHCLMSHIHLNFHSPVSVYWGFSQCTGTQCSVTGALSNAAQHTSIQLILHQCVPQYYLEMHIQHKPSHMFIADHKHVLVTGHMSKESLYLQ